MFEQSRIKFKDEDGILVCGLGPYDLEATLTCGQCFRYESLPDGGYLFVACDLLIRVYQPQPGQLVFLGISDEDFERVVRPLFSLDRDLDGICREVLESTDSEWLAKAAERAKGIAILSQEPAEALLSFIISQNNNIPRIRKIIRQISAPRCRYGRQRR